MEPSRTIMLPQHPCYADGEYDHDWEFQDESFDHEYGTETCGYWECLNCNLIDAD